MATLLFLLVLIHPVDVASRQKTSSSPTTPPTTPTRVVNLVPKILTISDSITEARYVYTPAPPPYTGPCGDNSYANFIYMHESGCRPTATNPTGCYGIGQDCNGRLKPLCGADYTCQNNFFNAYALNRYGSWLAAYNFWLSHSYW